MGSVIRRPYYKYKREAYNKLNRFGKSILKRVGFYENNADLRGVDLRFGSVTEGDTGLLSYYLEDRWVFNLNCDGSFTFSPHICLSAGRYESFLVSYFELVNKNLGLLFKDGSGTVVKALGDNVSEWYVSSDQCVFHAFSGAVFINEVDGNSVINDSSDIVV